MPLSAWPVAMLYAMGFFSWQVCSSRMHSIWTRANTVFAFTLTVLSAVTLLVYFSTFLFPTVIPITVSASNPRVNMADYSVEEGKSDVVMMSLNIHADLSPLFNWNVKQLFVYLVAEYSTMKNVVNEVVLWDKIVMREDSQVLLEESIHPKYYFMDDGNNLLSHQNVTLILKWNVIPNAGYLAMAQGDGSFVLKLPDNYVSGKL